MGEASELLMKLRPVTFRYREDAVGAEEAKTLQYGLIAEEVAEVAPELVAPDLEGRPYSVKYHELPALLALPESGARAHDCRAARGARRACRPRRAARGGASIAGEVIVSAERAAVSARP